jgi:hypothetical protein
MLLDTVHSEITATMRAFAPFEAGLGIPSWTCWNFAVAPFAPYFSIALLWICGVILTGQTGWRQ